MTAIFRVRRRAVGGAAGAPASLLSAELAYNEQTNILYYGGGNNAGAATSIFPIAGPGAFLPTSGGALSNGLGFGAAVAPGGVTDLSRHIALFGTTYGLNVTSSRLNLVAPALASHYFVVNGVDVGFFSTAGLNAAAIGATTPSTGAFTTLSATGAVSGAGFTTLLAPYAPLASPTFTGVPAAPTAIAGTNTTQLATTAFAMGCGVTTFNTRAGAVTLATADITGAGGAPLASPTFTGVPAAPTATAGTNTTQLATTAFAMGCGVTTFNTRAGAVTLATADITGAGGAPLASPVFTGAPSLPTGAIGVTQAVGDEDTSLATTAFAARLFGGYTAPNIADSDQTYTSANLGFRIINLAGALTADRTITLPLAGQQKNWLFRNGTTGGFNVIVLGGAVSYSIPPAYATEVWTQGTSLFPTQNLLCAATVRIGDATRNAFVFTTGAASGVSSITVSSGTLAFGNGVGFGSAVAPGGVTDLSRHVALYGTNFGFSVTSGRLNHVGTAHYFVSGATDVAAINAAGLTMLGTTDITLARDPSANLQAASKQYVDAAATSSSSAVTAYTTAGVNSYPDPGKGTTIGVLLYAGGGSGGSGSFGPTGSRGGGAGGGGGGAVYHIFRRADLIFPITVTVGAGGASVTTGTAGSTGANGNVGQPTTFGGYLAVSGGGGGSGGFFSGTAATSSAGGGGGGRTGPGVNGNLITGSTQGSGGGPPYGTAVAGGNVDNIGPGGGGSWGNAGNAEWGGAGGGLGAGDVSSGFIALPGGGSLYGGSGGGGGGSYNQNLTGSAGSAGGRGNTYPAIGSQGGGGTAGAAGPAIGVAGGPGTAGNTTVGGSGGGGGGGSLSGPGAAGGAGGACGGGGGGASGGSNAGGASGAGGVGAAFITVW